MTIGLINENSQASKNNIIYESLIKVLGKEHKVINFTPNDSDLTYVQVGLLTGILLNSKAVDFVVTGCGTGVGAMMACNAMPNVTCGLATDPTDAYLFSQINAGNAISIPYAKGFGWGAELTLEYLFEKLFSCEFGGGYPKERVIPEQKNKKILDEVKNITHHSMIDILKNIDQKFLIDTINLETFKKYFFDNSKNKEISEYLKKLI